MYERRGQSEGKAENKHSKPASPQMAEILDLPKLITVYDKGPGKARTMATESASRCI